MFKPRGRETPDADAATAMGTTGLCNAMLLPRLTPVVSSSEDQSPRMKGKVSGTS